MRLLPRTQTRKQGARRGADELDPTSTEGLDVLGECLTRADPRRRAARAPNEMGGWCHTTGRCTAAGDRVGASRKTATVPPSTSIRAPRSGRRRRRSCPRISTRTRCTRFATREGRAITSLERACDDGYAAKGARMCPGREYPCRCVACATPTRRMLCDPGYGGSRCESVVLGCACGVAHTHVNADGRRQPRTGRDSNGAACVSRMGGRECADACPGAGVVGAEVCGATVRVIPPPGRATATRVTHTHARPKTRAPRRRREACGSCVGGSRRACRGQFDGYACDQCKCGANGRCNALSGECGAIGTAGEPAIAAPTPTCQNGGAVERRAQSMRRCNSGKSALATSTAIRTSNAAVTGRATPTSACSPTRSLEYRGTGASGYGPYPEEDAAAAECSDASGGGYDGTTNSTISGKQCQRGPRRRRRQDPTRASKGSTTHQCRNLSGTAAHPCYVDTNALTGPGTYE